MNQILEILPSNELFISILQLVHPQILEISNIPDNIEANITEIISQFDNQLIDFKLLRKVLLKKDSNIFEVGLKYINLSINYTQDVVQTLADVNFTEADNLYAAAYLSLFIFLERMSTKKVDDSLPFLLQILNKFTKIKEIRHLLISAFLELYNVYIESNSTNYLNQILIVMYDFYSHNLDLPKQSYMIIGTTASKFFDKHNITINHSEIEFFSFIDMLAIERGSYFPNEVLETCVKCLNFSLSQFDLFAITFFSHFSDRLSIKFNSTYFALFPLAISSYIMISPPYTQPIIINDDDQISSQNLIDTKSSKEISKSGKINEIDFETSFVLPEQQPISSFINPDVKNRLNLIVKSAEQKSELMKILVDNFTDLLKKMIGTEYILDLLAILFETTSHFPPVYDSTSLFETINGMPIFDQRVNILSQGPHFQTVSSFRAASFDFCCRNNFLSDFVNENIKRPFILAEHLQRIIQSDFNFGDKQKALIVKSAINAELQFQKLLYENKGIQIARASIFVLLSRFLSDSSYSVKFFDDDWFCTVFILSFLFEKPLRSFVLSSTRKNLIVDDSKSPKVIRNYGSAIEIASTSLPSLESLDLTITILNMLSEVVSSKPSMVDCFSIIREKVSRSLSLLAQSLTQSGDVEAAVREKSEEFFIKSIQFFAQTSSLHQKTLSAHISAFESIGKALYSDSIPDFLFGKIVQLISGSLTPSFESNFIIREPKFVCFFLKFYKQNAPKFIEALLFINKLCEFSRENCILCHKEKVDCFLIDVLVAMKVNYNPSSSDDNETVEQVLSLLCSIVSVCSSVSFVHQCFSLFTPVQNEKKGNEKCISLLQPKFINTISQIINKTGNNPSAYFPLLSNGVRIQFNLDQSFINKGFSFVCWVCLDSSTPQYMPNILHISDNSNQKINLFLKSNNLMFRITNRKTSSTGIFEKCIPLRSWTYISVNFMKSDFSNETDKVFITINEKSVKELYYPRIALNGGQIKFVIGGTIENSIDSENPALLATFGLFQTLEITEINHISEQGPKLKEIPILSSKIRNYFDSEESNETEKELTIDDKLLVMIKTTSLNNQLKLDFVPTDSSQLNIGKIDMNSFLFIQPETILKQNQSFTNILLSSVKVDNLIPLFSQHDLTYINGEPYSPQCEELALLVLGSVLASSYDAQQSMYESNGFDMICHLFFVSKSSHFTYKLYTKFFNLYQTMTFVPLQQQIFFGILFNFDLLMKTSPVDHLLILKHWNRSLFPATLSHKIEAISFKHIVTGLVVYYWDLEPQHKFIFRDESFGHLDLEKCRKCIIDVACQVAQYNFNIDDLSSLLSFIVNGKDDVILEHLLALLKSLISIEKGPIEKVKSAKYDLSVILYLLNHKEESIIADTFDILIILINNKIINNISLVEMADIIIRQISPDFPTEILLQHIIALMIDGTYELLSICMYFSFDIGIERLKKFVRSIQPSNLYCCHFSWSFWPIIICYKLDSFLSQSDPLIDEILSFLFECGLDQWVNILVMTDFVSQLLSTNSSKLKSRALKLLCEMVLKARASFDEIKSACSCCIELVIRFLFFRAEEEENEAFNELYNNSIFNETGTIQKEKVEPPSFKETDRVINVPLIYERFSKIKKYSAKLHLGLRFDKNGSWIDIELAKSCISVFIKYASSLIANDENYNFSNEVIAGPVLAISSYLVRSNPSHISFIRPIVQLIQSNQNFNVNDSANISSIQYYISYLEYSVKMTKSDVFYHVRNDSRQCINLASQTLEKLKNIELKNVISAETKLPIQLNYFFEKNWKKSIQIFSLLDDNIVLKASTITRNFILENENKKKENAKRWGHLWRSLALNERAPWNDGIDKIPIRWRRDFSACHFTIPFKLKRNWHINETVKLNDSSEKVGEIESNKVDSHDLSFDNFEPTKDEKQIDSSNFGNLKGLFDCEIVKVSGTFQGKLYIYSELLSFVSEDKTKNIFLNDIRDIYLRNRIHLPTAIEIFMTNGRSYLINFTTVNGSQVISKLSKLSMSNLQNIQMDDMETYFKMNSWTEKWVLGKVSNFEYLMHLNLMSGRTFNDLSQYPVLPWVVADFSSENLDLTDPKTFRNLAKPIGALNDQKLLKIKERADQILEAEDKPYLYTCGFLYPNVIIDFLYNIEPFTSLHKKLYQNGVDNSHSTFHSIARVWEQVQTQINDNWELIPEFYSTPEFLTNLDNFFNEKSRTKKENRDTILPPWAASSFDFVYKMRMALESDYVSHHLNEWIDLIWGVKQRSLEDYNVFRPEAYSDIWKAVNMNPLTSSNNGQKGEKSEEDEDRIESIKTSLLNMSQMPPQLFEVPHPVRSIPLRFVKDSWSVYSYQTEIQAVSAAFFEQTPTKLVIILVTSMMNKIFRCYLAPKIKKKSGGHRVKRVKSSIDIKSKFLQLFDISYTAKDIKKKFTQAILDQKHVFSFLSPSTIIFSASGSSEVSFINVNNGHHNEISTPLSETSAIDCGNDYFVVACRNSVVNVYKFGCSLEMKSLPLLSSSITEKTVSLTSLDSEEQISLKSESSSFLGLSSSLSFSSTSAHQIASIASYRSKLPCVALSEKFNLIVNGTSDGFIVISSLKSLAVEKIIQISDDGKPLLILVSPSWGFIVVYTSKIDSGIVTKNLLVFNVNGKIISKNQIDFSVSCMVTFSDCSGFDHILIADSIGTIYESEIYKLDFSKPLYRCHDKIVNLYYNNEEFCIVAISATGKIFIISHNFV